MHIGSWQCCCGGHFVSLTSMRQDCCETALPLCLRIIVVRLMVCWSPTATAGNPTFAFQTWTVPLAHVLYQRSGVASTLYAWIKELRGTAAALPRVADEAPTACAAAGGSGVCSSWNMGAARLLVPSDCCCWLLLLLVLSSSKYALNSSLQHMLQVQAPKSAASELEQQLWFEQWPAIARLMLLFSNSCEQVDIGR